MRIILSYGSESDKGEGVHYVNVLRRMGHNVFQVNVAAPASRGVPGRVIRGYPPEITVPELSQEAGGADLFLYIEPFGLIPRGMEKSPIPTACVISDVHRNLESRIKLARFFDRVFLYQRDYAPRFNEHPQGAVKWMPYACDHQFFRDTGVPRDLDVAFIGQLSNTQGRRRIVEELSRRHKMNELRYHTQAEIPQVYSRAKIVVNIPAGDDLNFRVFEALACGAMLLTKRLNTGQEELFKEGVHFAAYDGEQELLEKADYYLSHEDERARIALAGHEEFLARHTLEKRLEWMLSEVARGPAESAPVRKMAHRQAVREYASLYERTGRIEALMTLAADNADDRRLWAGILIFGMRAFARRAIKKW